MKNFPFGWQTAGTPQMQQSNTFDRPRSGFEMGRSAAVFKPVLSCRLAVCPERAARTRRE
ncbi:hypothetical protein [Nereida sp.]|uniref:hypothetical protein n=1 Tax=Nereida sp. TaxID=2736090 RepID=UPI003F69C972